MGREKHNRKTEWKNNIKNKLLELKESSEANILKKNNPQEITKLEKTMPFFKLIREELSQMKQRIRKILAMHKS